MTGREYLERVLTDVREKHEDKPEFIQAVSELLPTLEPYLDEHPEIEEHSILEIMIEGLSRLAILIAS